MKKLYTIALLIMGVTFVAESSANVTFYEHSNFQGASRTITSNWSFTQERCWNDEISSIVIPEGWRVIIYEHNWGGRSMTLTCNWSVTGWNDWWNDRISSIQVIPPATCPVNGHAGVTLFEHTNFRGAQQLLSNNASTFLGYYWNDKISSIRIPPGWTVVIYEHARYGGTYCVLTEDWTATDWRDPWNDRISSIEVIPPDQSLSHY